MFTTAGLFFTLGKITPPFRTTDFVGIAFHEEVVGDVGRVVLTSILFVLVLEEIGWTFVDKTPDVGPIVGYGVVDILNARVVVDGEVTGSFKSVKVSSITEYLCEEM